MKHLTLLSTAIIFIITNCYFVFPSNSPAAAATSATTYSGLKVLIKEDCIIRPTKSADPSHKESLVLTAAITAIASTLAKPVIAASLDLAAEYFKNLKDKYKASITQLSAHQFYKISPDGKGLKLGCGCMILAYGNFGPHQATMESDNQPWYADALNKLNLTQAPDFYLELAFKYDDAFNSFRLQPRFLDSSKHLAERIGRRKTKDISISFEFATVSPGKEPVTTFANSMLVFPDLRVGTRLDIEALEGISSQWMPLLPPIKRSTTIAGIESTIFDTRPFTAKVTILESEDAGDLYLIASKIIADNRDKLSDDLGKIVIDFLTNSKK